MEVQESLVQINENFEQEAEKLIDSYFEQRSMRIDSVEMAEKYLILKELALANKRSEIVPKLNELRVSRGLPALSKDFDLQYYAREYAPLIESISLHYAQNLAKKFRFANRIVRVAKLNELAEHIRDRIQSREGDAVDRTLKEKDERLHNDNIKIFASLMSAIDEQMGKVRMTKIDVGVHQSDKPVIENAKDVQDIIAKALRNHLAQLPDSVEANFTPVTDYEKCEFGEQLGQVHHCWFFNEQCKVQTGEIETCNHYLNRHVLRNKEWMQKQYQGKKLTVREIADLAGCKEIDDKVLDRIKARLKDFGIRSKDTGRDS